MKEILNILKHRGQYDASRHRFLELLHTQKEYDILSQYAFFSRPGDDAVGRKRRCFEVLSEIANCVEFLRRGAGMPKSGRRMSREGLMPMTLEEEEHSEPRGTRRAIVAAKDLRAVQACVFAMKTLGAEKDTLVVESSLAQGRIHLAFLDLKNARKELVVNGETLNSMHLRNFISAGTFNHPFASNSFSHSSSHVQITRASPMLCSSEWVCRWTSFPHGCSTSSLSTCAAWDLANRAPPTTTSTPSSPVRPAVTSVLRCSPSSTS